MIILGIETSCDDTGIALVECDSPSPRLWRAKQKCRILSNIISSQIKIHAPFGGVVPNLAARAHLKNIEPCLKQALKQAEKVKIDLIAVTKGPGLAPSLLIGVNFAKALAYQWQKPIIDINHIEGHIYANWLNNPKIEFPVLCLVVSGGHTQLILMKDHGKYQLLGETRDDAAGEAFDKVAKLLGLGYPGGPILSQKALKGDSSAFDLPRPMIHNKDYDFSFSGLKTAVLYKVRQNEVGPQNTEPFQHVNNMAASFQQAVIDVLIYKTIRAAKQYKPKTIILSGGVAANSELRKQMEEKINNLGIKFQMPDIKLCTDNGAMIAAVAAYKKKPVLKRNQLHLSANANLKLVA
ncbi:tRNA (adenosine(37)-N6)-threonylcarbamoyltransferase complex transferase subunit TsaD [Patescibacteria group bacterium]|nr:tRNA (adenosine(37)-N6)-threonylcarbamoyltransferase complex transferase subunit TsaD [Patescibacteria group bacterium]MBU2068164.1 tRNA (adenosine(37)-N6)-threonylcarbamoyltransferase complex transferase subunit TsaD [Patescibacteria group bacterium]